MIGAPSCKYPQLNGASLEKVSHSIVQALFNTLTIPVAFPDITVSLPFLHNIFFITVPPAVLVLN